MPYIKQERREDFDLELITKASAGDLNFSISRLINSHLILNGLSYTSINEVIGVLECAKLELYRRIAAPYENKKKDENGDVYTV